MTSQNSRQLSENPSRKQSSDYQLSYLISDDTFSNDQTSSKQVTPQQKNAIDLQKHIKLQAEKLQQNSFDNIQPKTGNNNNNDILIENQQQQQQQQENSPKSTTSQEYPQFREETSPKNEDQEIKQDKKIKKIVQKTVVTQSQQCQTDPNSKQSEPCYEEIVQVIEVEIDDSIIKIDTTTQTDIQTPPQHPQHNNNNNLSPSKPKHRRQSSKASQASPQTDELLSQQENNNNHENFSSSQRSENIQGSVKSVNLNNESIKIPLVLSQRDEISENQSSPHHVSQFEEQYSIHSSYHSNSEKQQALQLDQQQVQAVNNLFTKKQNTQQQQEEEKEQKQQVQEINQELFQKMQKELQQDKPKQLKIPLIKSPDDTQNYQDLAVNNSDFNDEENLLTSNITDLSKTGMSPLPQQTKLQPQIFEGVDEVSSYLVESSDQDQQSSTSKKARRTPSLVSPSYKNTDQKFKSQTKSQPVIEEEEINECKTPENERATHNYIKKISEDLAEEQEETTDRNRENEENNKEELEELEEVEDNEDLDADDEVAQFEALQKKLQEEFLEKQRQLAEQIEKKKLEKLTKKGKHSKKNSHEKASQLLKVQESELQNQSNLLMSSSQQSEQQKQIENKSNKQQQQLKPPLPPAGNTPDSMNQLSSQNFDDLKSFEPEIISDKNLSETQPITLDQDQYQSIKNSFQKPVAKEVINQFSQKNPSSQRLSPVQSPPHKRPSHIRSDSQQSLERYLKSQVNYQEEIDEFEKFEKEIEDEEVKQEFLLQIEQNSHPQEQNVITDMDYFGTGDSKIQNHPGLPKDLQYISEEEEALYANLSQNDSKLKQQQQHLLYSSSEQPLNIIPTPKSESSLQKSLKKCEFPAQNNEKNPQQSIQSLNDFQQSQSQSQKNQNSSSQAPITKMVIHDDLENDESEFEKQIKEQQQREFEKKMKEYRQQKKLKQQQQSQQNSMSNYDEQQDQEEEEGQQHEHRYHVPQTYKKPIVPQIHQIFQQQDQSGGNLDNNQKITPKGSVNHRHPSEQTSHSKIARSPQMFISNNTSLSQIHHEIDMSHNKSLQEAAKHISKLQNDPYSQARSSLENPKIRNSYENNNNNLDMKQSYTQQDIQGEFDEPQQNNLDDNNNKLQSKNFKTYQTSEDDEDERIQYEKRFLDLSKIKKQSDSDMPQLSAQSHQQQQQNPPSTNRSNKSRISHSIENRSKQNSLNSSDIFPPQSSLIQDQNNAQTEVQTNQNFISSNYYPSTEYILVEEPGEQQYSSSNPSSQHSSSKHSRQSTNPLSIYSKNYSQNANPYNPKHKRNNSTQFKKDPQQQQQKQKSQSQIPQQLQHPDIISFEQEFGYDEENLIEDQQQQFDQKIPEDDGQDDIIDGIEQEDPLNQQQFYKPGTSNYKKYKLKKRLPRKYYQQSDQPQIEEQDEDYTSSHSRSNSMNKNYEENKNQYEEEGQEYDQVQEHYSSHEHDEKHMPQHNNFLIRSSMDEEEEKAINEKLRKKIIIRDENTMRISPNKSTRQQQQKQYKEYIKRQKSKDPEQKQEKKSTKKTKNPAAQKPPISGGTPTRKASLLKLQQIPMSKDLVDQEYLQTLNKQQQKEYLKEIRILWDKKQREKEKELEELQQMQKMIYEQEEQIKSHSQERRNSQQKPRTSAFGHYQTSEDERQKYPPKYQEAVLKSKERRFMKNFMEQQQPEKKIGHKKTLTQTHNTSHLNSSGYLDSSKSGSQKRPSQGHSRTILYNNPQQQQLQQSQQYVPKMTRYWQKKLETSQQKMQQKDKDMESAIEQYFKNALDKSSYDQRTSGWDNYCFFSPNKRRWDKNKYKTLRQIEAEASNPLSNRKDKQLCKHLHHFDQQSDYDQYEPQPSFMNLTDSVMQQREDKRELVQRRKMQQELNLMRSQHEQSFSYKPCLSSIHDNTVHHSMMDEDFQENSIVFSDQKDRFNNRIIPDIDQIRRKNISNASNTSRHVTQILKSPTDKNNKNKKE